MASYTVSDVSEMLSVSEETVRRWIRDGKLKAKRGLGRSGNSIELTDVVDFVNCSSPAYLYTLKHWLETHDIEYNPLFQTHKESYTSSRSWAALDAILPPKTGIRTTTELVGIQLKNPISPAYHAENVEADAFDEVLEHEKKYIDAVRTEEECSGSDIKTDELKLKIIDAKMQLTQFKQELAQIQAKITITEEQISYYNLLLQKQENMDSPSDEE